MSLDQLVGAYKKMVQEGGAQRAQRAKKVCRTMFYVSYGLLAAMATAKGINWMEGDPNTLLEYMLPEGAIPKGVAQLYDGAAGLYLATMHLQNDKEEHIEAYMEKHFTKGLSLEEKREVQKLSDEWLKTGYVNDGSLVGSFLFLAGFIGAVIGGVLVYKMGIPRKKAMYQARLDVIKDQQTHVGW